MKGAAKGIIGLLALCASAVMAQPAAPASACGSGANGAICLGEMDVPQRFRSTFADAGRLAIDGVSSQAFAADLASFMTLHTGGGAHAKAWQGLDPSTIVADLSRGMQGREVTTYGGLRGWFVNAVFGNVAYDGEADGPIRLNRAALPRPAASIANTIAHEVAHRTGLKHPHSKRQLAVARCEPPYVIGSLVEKHATGSTWQVGADDCPLLGP